MIPLLSARSLRLARGEFLLDIEALDLFAGSCVGLAGPNGAGKTTLLDILGGRLPCGGASLLLRETPLASFGMYRPLAVGTVPDRLLGIKAMSVREHLGLRSRVFPWWDAAYVERMLDELEIPSKTSLSALSKGTQAKVAFVSVEAFRPPVLLLDEPTSGLDPVVRRELRRVLHRALLERPERCILFSTHLLEDLEDMVDRLLVIKSGKLIADTRVSRTVTREQRRIVLDGAMELLQRGGKDIADGQ